jgi:thiamine phosphate synthase YjbQ (UPF0047 family)
MPSLSPLVILITQVQRSGMFRGDKVLLLVILSLGVWNIATVHGHRRECAFFAACSLPRSIPPSSSWIAATVEEQSQSPSRSSSAGTSSSLGRPVCEYHQVSVPTSQSGPPRQAISVEDLTPVINDLLSSSGMKNGVVHVISRHTTTAITINERESRLAQDMAEYFLKLVPPDERSSCEQAKNASHGVRYYHNDIDQRPDSEQEAQRCRNNGWNIDDPAELQAWRDQEPINAHSHIIAMLLGSSESIPVVDGKMVIGQWQSILLVDLDGPRDRMVGIQFLGYQ